MEKKIRGLLFDKDATLLDFEKTWGGWAFDFLSSLAKGDAHLRQQLARAVGYQLDERSFHPSSPVIAGTPEEGVDLLLPYLPDWGRDQLLAFSNETAKQAPVHALVPLAPLLDSLKPNCKLGVATNDTELTARRHMSELGVADRFDCILGSDSGFGGKPGPGMCLAFAQQVGLPPDTIAMVGDSTHDLFAGRAAGMRCIGVTSGFATDLELSPHADAVLPDVSYLPDWIAGQG